ncbi:MAG: thermonuclease family protein [Desulfovibrionales bacterium]
MRIRAFPVVVVLFVLLPLCAAQAGTKSGRAAAVLDGDTLILASGETVRLLGIDCPEMPHEDDPGQYYSSAAKRTLADLVMGEALKIEYEKHDRYGRILGRVRLGDGPEVNTRLVASGAAFFYYHRDLPPGFEEEIMRAQRRAMRMKKGFWRRVLALETEHGFWIGHRFSRRFHDPGCRHGKRISSKKRILFGSLQEAFWEGFAPCRVCTPWPGKGYE